ncbi:cytochrome P450 [Sporormia fimetaria CBS 119925]|uniref:Cytochrome P450 n=1 Tax=Sporormia fimetaria CBS 119925 TaxID=1340428 RepID=A0A6A6V5A5_9PLEO|nr:cytochrome P450 [Sporormia fimetaria CBS 119925]
MFVLERPVAWVLVVASALLLSVFLQRLCKSVYQYEPPRLPWGNVRTLFQHIPGLVTRRLVYFNDIASKWQKPIFTIDIFGTPIYIVASTEYLNSIQRQSRLFSFRFFVGYFAPRIVGGNKRTLESFIANIHGDPEKPENMLSKGEKLTRKAMASQNGAEMTSTAVQLFIDRITATSEQSFDAPVDLWEWVRHEVTLSSTGAMYGPYNPYKDPKVEQGFWLRGRRMFIDQVLWLGVTSSLPKSIVSRLLSGFNARETVVQALSNYFHAGQHHYASHLTRTQHPCFAEHLDFSEVARFEVANALGAVGTSAPAAFWVLYHLFSDPVLLERARKQADSAMMSDSIEDGAEKVKTKVVDLRKISDAPLFLSLVEEVLRYRSEMIGVRVVMEDGFLTGNEESYRVRKGGIVVIPNREIHREKSAWGDDAHMFVADRFCTDTPRKAFRAFGNGPTACCGRQFATRHIASFAALMVTLFDLVPVDDPCGRWTDPGMDSRVIRRDGLVQAHALPPAESAVHEGDLNAASPDTHLGLSKSQLFEGPRNLGNHWQNQTGHDAAINGQFVPRRVSDEVYEAMRQKGCNFMQAMSKTDAEAAWWVQKTGSAESAFQKVEAWGYAFYTVEDFRYGAPEYEEAYEALGLDPDKELGGGDKGPNKVVGIRHERETVHDGVQYRPTKAYFETIVNPEDGVIMAWMPFGAAHMAQVQKPPVTVLPKLKNWSDIAFLSWKSQGGGKNLKYVWRAQISNEFTEGLLGRALSEHPNGRRANKNGIPFDNLECDHDYSWDRRVEFSTTDTGGLVLLASPNGRGAAHLLLEHKATFGDKATIGKVSFFCSGDWEQNLLFHVYPNGI